MATGYANTAALISFSVQQNADGMLNLLLTDKAALNAPMSAFVISDQSMVSAFWDYLAGMIRIFVDKSHLKKFAVHAKTPLKKFLFSAILE